MWTSPVVEYGALVYRVKILGFQSGVVGSIPTCVAKLVDTLETGCYIDSTN